MPKNIADKLLFSFPFHILAAGGFLGNLVDRDTYDPNKKNPFSYRCNFQKNHVLEVAFTKYRVERTCYG